MHKRKLQIRRQTIRFLTGSYLDRVAGGGLPTIMTTQSDNPPPPPPHTNSIAPCCASDHKACPLE